MNTLKTEKCAKQKPEFRSYYVRENDEIRIIPYPILCWPALVKELKVHLSSSWCMRNVILKGTYFAPQMATHPVPGKSLDYFQLSLLFYEIPY